jgi:hypothetical protein
MFWVTNLSNKSVETNLYLTPFKLFSTQFCTKFGADFNFIMFLPYIHIDNYYWSLSITTICPFKVFVQYDQQKKDKGRLWKIKSLKMCGVTRNIVCCSFDKISLHHRCV